MGELNRIGIPIKKDESFSVTIIVFKRITLWEVTLTQGRGMENQLLRLAQVRWRPTGGLRFGIKTKRAARNGRNRL